MSLPLRRRIGVLANSRFVRDSGVLLSGTVLAQIIMLAVSPVVTRLFSPAAFGIFSFVMALVTMLSIVGTLRLDMIITAVRARRDAIRLAQAMLLAGLVFAVAGSLFVGLIGSSLAARYAPHMHGLGAAIQTLPWLVLAYACYMSARSLAVRGARFSRIGRGQVWRSATLAVVWIGLGLVSAHASPGLGLLVGQLLADLIFAYLLLKSMPGADRRVLFHFDLYRVWAVFWAQSGMISALVSSQTLAAIYLRLPVLVIGFVFGPVEAGFYALAERIIAAPAALAMAVGDVYRQRASAAFRAGENFAGLMRNVLLVQLSLSVVPYAIAIALTPVLIGKVFGAAWQDASFTMMVLLVGSLFAFNSQPVDKAPIITGARRYIILWHVMRFAFEIIAAALAIFGVVGFETYLVMSVAGRCLAYVIDTSYGFMLAGSVKNRSTDGAS